jgi:tyrosine-protein kinase
MARSEGTRMARWPSRDPTESIGSRAQGSSGFGGEAVDIRDYLGVLRRRFWLIVGSCVVSLGLILAYSFSQTPIYKARTEVLVQSSLVGVVTGLRPDQLVSLETEKRLVKSAPIAEKARTIMGSSLSVQDLLDHVSVDVAPETLVLDIAYSDVSPTEAARGANAFAEGYLQFKLERGLDAMVALRASIDRQIEDIREQSEDLARDLRGIDPTSPQGEAIQGQIDALEDQVAILLAQKTSVPSTVDPGTIILPATAPTFADAPKHPVNAAIGLFLGLFFGVILAFVRDRTDDRLRGRSDLEDHLWAPVLAVIPKIPNWRKRDPARPVTLLQPRSIAAEAYRTLRTSILAMAAQRGAKTFMIVSSLPGEGKTTTTANLGVALAQAGKRVLVVSADLRRPRLHEFFGLPNARGLSEALAEEAQGWDSLLNTGVGELWLMPSGRVPHNPAELLQARNLHELLAEQEKLFDFVLVDSPPILGLADGLVIASVVDVVLFVAQPELSRLGAIMQAREQLERIGVTVHGGILNNVRTPRRGTYHSYGYTTMSKYLEGEPPGSHQDLSRLEGGFDAERLSLRDSGDPEGDLTRGAGPERRPRTPA